MKGKIIPMLGLAVVFGGISIFAADRWVKSQAANAVSPVEAQAPQAPAIETTKIVVVKEALKYGTEVTAEMLQEIDWPSSAVPAGSFKSVAEVTGGEKRVVLSAFAQNEPLLLSKLSGKDGRGSLSNLIEPGMRAVTVRVDDITGVAGFVTAGDRVDILLTRQTVKPSEGEGEQTASPQNELASEVVLQNVKVLTLDQSADNTNVTAVIAKAVTVEVTSDDAQKVALAQQLGTLYLVLRPAGEDAVAANTSLTASDLGGKSAKGDETASTNGALPAAAPVASASILNMENEGPKFRSLVVTRGHVAESYSVIDEKGSAIKPTVSGQ
ncbi:MAG: Flp pilus assembly protein CpaB [Rhizobiaceae bacterium]